MVAPLDPSTVLFGRTRQGVLSLFFTRPDESFYLREIVRRTGCGTGAVQRELQQLTESGILQRERDRFYRVNRDSPVFEPLKQLIIRTAGLADGLRNSLSTLGRQIRVAFIFGSFADGEPHQASDVDVMIVTRDNGPSLKKFVALFRDQQISLGREINPFVLSAGELRTKLRDGNHFLGRVLKGEKVFLIGDDNELGRVAQERLAEGSPNKRLRNRRPSRAGRP